MESDINIDTEEGDGPLVEVEVWNALRFLLYVLFVKFSNIRTDFTTIYFSITWKIEFFEEIYE